MADPSPAEARHGVLSRWRAIRQRIRARHAAVLAAGVVVVGALVAFGPRLLLGPQVEVATVVRREFVQSVVASGHVEAPHRVTIGAQVTGVVKRIPVVEGQRVEPGQVLVELERSEAEATLDAAELAVLQAEARLRQLREVQAPVAEQGLRQARVNFETAEAQLRRQRDLLARGFIGQAALDESQRAFESSEAQLRTAERQVQTAEPSGSDSAVVRAALAQARAGAGAARARLAYATIVAPAAGTLIDRSVEPGDVVQPGKALMVLSPAGASQLVVQIDEKNLQRLAVGQPAQASADAYPELRFDAVVAFINPGVDVQRGSVEVKLDVPRPPAVLRQNMTVSVDVQVARRADALLVPADAVHEADGGAPWVLQVVDGRVRRQAIRLGLRGHGQSEVRDGLEAGAEVVVGVAAGLGDGARVRIARPSRLPAASAPGASPASP